MNKPLFTTAPLVAQGIYQRPPALIPLFWVSIPCLNNKGIRVRLLGVASATKGALENKGLIFKQLCFLT